MTTQTTPRLGCAVFLALMAGAASAEADLDAGRKIFTETAQPACALCHALKDVGSEAEVGPNLDEFKPTVDQVRAAVTSGIGVMPAFSETLTKEEIETVSKYVAHHGQRDQSCLRLRAAYYAQTFLLPFLWTPIFN